MSSLLALLNIGLLLLSTLLSGDGARYFKVDKNSGQAPLVVTFSAKDLKDAKLAQKFIWNFGDGQTLTTTDVSVVHTCSV